jgi:hypothetical protein
MAIRTALPHRLLTRGRPEVQLLPRPLSSVLPAPLVASGLRAPPPGADYRAESTGTAVGERLPVLGRPRLLAGWEVMVQRAGLARGWAPPGQNQARHGRVAARRVRSVVALGLANAVLPWWVRGSSAARLGPTLVQVQPPAGEVITRSYALTMAIVVVCCLVRHGGVLVGHLDVWAGRLSGGATTEPRLTHPLVRQA